MLNQNQFAALWELVSYGLQGVASPADVSVMGEGNLKALIQRVRAKERALSYDIEEAYGRAALFDGKSGDDFAALAKAFELPVVKLSTTPGHLGYFEPVDPDSLSRKGGSTTLRMCGWCKYSNGSKRYEYTVESYCGLTHSFEEMASVEWASTAAPCRVAEFSASQCQEFAQKWHTRVEDLKVRRNTVRDLIKALQGIAQNQPMRPMLPALRREDHFNLGDIVGVYIENMQSRTIPGPWVKATVIPGYRHHDGCVSFVAENPFHTGENLNGAGGFLSSVRSDIVQAWELEALLAASNSDDLNERQFFDLFTRAAGHTTGVLTTEYRAALETQHLAN